MITYLLTFFEIVLEARRGDFHRHMSKVALIGSGIASYLEFGDIWHWILIRFVIFDLSIGWLREGNPFYLGKTSLYDLFLKQFNKWLLLFLRVAALTFLIYYEKII